MSTPQHDWRDWLPQWAPALAVLGGLASAVFYVGGELTRLNHLEQSLDQLEQGQLRLEQRLEDRIARMETRMEALFGELRAELRDDRRNIGNDIANLRERVSALEAKVKDT